MDFATDHTRPATRRENLGTSVFATWLILGLFVDGWAHNNQPELESFWTPWHGLFYSGFTATAIWIAWIVRRRLDGTKGISGSIPPGYGAAAIGLMIFAVGGIGDAFWHTIFGVETSFDALLSPTHILLFIGIVMIVTAPMRSVAHSNHGRSLPRGEFLPVGISMTLTTLIITFFFMYTYAPVSGAATVRFIPNVTGGFEAEFGLLQIYLTTAILTGCILYLASRWHVPFGTFTAMFIGIGILFQGMLEEFNEPWQILTPVAAGLAADVLIRRLDPDPRKTLAWLSLGAAIPIAMWSTHFLVFATFRNVGWTVELWAGAIVVTGVIGAAMAHVFTHAGSLDRSEDEGIEAPARSLSDS